MKKLIAIFLLLAFALPALAIVNDGEVMYLGGTAVGVKEGATGKFDTTQAENLVFEAKEVRLQIPYANVTSFEYSRKLARHLGIAPTIAVAMVKHLQRRHFFTIDYKDQKGVAQSAVFEVSKDMPQTLEAVLRVRAPRKEVSGAYPRYQVNCSNQGCSQNVPPCSVNSACPSRTDLAPAPQPNPTAQSSSAQSAANATSSQQPKEVAGKSVATDANAIT